MRCYTALLIVFVVGLTSAVRAADEEDPVVFNKKASEWMEILKSDKEAKRRKISLVALDSAGPRTKKIFGAVGRALREDEDEAVRVEAAFRLGKLAVKAQMDKDRIPTDEAVDFLTQALGKDKAPAVREEAAKALMGVGLNAKDAVEVLGAALKEPHPGLRAAAAECLGKLEYLYRLEKTQSLIKPTLQSLLTVLKDSTGKEYVTARSYIIYAIGRIGGGDASSAVPVFIEVLGEKEVAAETRRKLAETLGAFGKEGAPATGVLAKLLDDADVDVQRAAATALDQIGVDAKAAIPDMLKAASPPDTKDPKAPRKDRFVRSHCIHALGKMGKELGEEHTPKAILLFRDCLKDNLPDIRLAAINALTALGTEGLGKSLEAVKGEIRVALRDTNGDVREAAETALKTLEGNP